jgi:transcription factor C subunit 6
MPDGEEEPEEELDEDLNPTSDESDKDYPESESSRPTTPKRNTVEIDFAQTPTASTIGPKKHPNKSRTSTTAYGKGKAPIQFTIGGGSRARAVGTSELRTRGVADFTKVGGQEVRLKDLFGPTNEHLKPVLLTRDHWAKQETLPLREPGSVRRSFFEAAEGRKKETRTTNKWYTDVGRDAFQTGQKSRNLTEEEAEVYMACPGPDSLNVLSGTVDAPQVHPLKQLSCINVAEPFRDKRNRHGWLLNLGSRIQDAQWAVCEQSNTQYLAIAIEQCTTEGRQPKPMENPKAPAFSATRPFPASVQIWAFDGTEEGTLDTTCKPRLQTVLCTDWGAPKQVRWCPVEIIGTSDVGENNPLHIGLLAGMWSDGKVRVLDVQCSEQDVGQPHYVNVLKAAFEVSFPHTVPSNILWLSGTTLAVSTSGGNLAIWTLSRSGTLSSSPNQNHSPKPWFYQQIAETYILTLSSGRPSLPHLISITTADGFARLYDIRTPNADTTASIRGRTLCLTQAWHEQTQSFVGPDEFYMLKHNPIRRYYHNLYSMRAFSSIFRCATSSLHPTILIGGADGTVEASNPIGRITNYKIIPWQQTWFKHEWRGPVENLVLRSPGEDLVMKEGEPIQQTVGLQGTTDINATDLTSAQKTTEPSGTTSASSMHLLSEPLVRITEGYKAFQPGIQHSVTSKKEQNPEVSKGMTIYEEQSAITALAWNPNLKFGTWAVAGMGSGLLRVEDIGV